LLQSLAALDKYISDNWGTINSEDFYFKTIAQFVKNTAAEITQTVKEWADCIMEADGFVAAHSLLVLYRSMKLEEFSQLSNHEQNIVKWACLLHDVHKVQWPTIESKDHVHPFKSSHGVLSVFHRLGLI